MATSFWLKTDRFMRSLHLYSGLFLSPWMLVYAASALFLNHDAWVRDRLHVAPPSWELVREVPFAPQESLPDAPSDQALAILRELDLDGPHRILGTPTPQQLVIVRVSGAGNYRITWRRPQSVLIVEQLRPFSGFRLLHYLHFRGGYGQHYTALIFWAVIVDAVAVSLWLWVVSGIYLWARRPSKRRLGGVCLVLGCGLFSVLVALLCR